MLCKMLIHNENDCCKERANDPVTTIALSKTLQTLQRVLYIGIQQ